MIRSAAAAAAFLAGDQLLFFSRLCSSLTGEEDRELGIQDLLARLLKVPVIDLVRPGAGSALSRALLRPSLSLSSSSAGKVNLDLESRCLVFREARRKISLLADCMLSLTLVVLLV